MLTWALARRLEGSDVTANAMAPGLIAETGLYRQYPPEELVVASATMAADRRQRAGRRYRRMAGKRPRAGGRQRKVF